MEGINVSQYIEAPPEKVFEVASDFAELPQIIAGIQKVEMLTDGPVRLGAKFRETRMMFGREATEEMEVTTFDAPRAFALDAENHGCRFHSVMTFTPKGDGTDVELSFEATPLTAIAKIMATAMQPMIKKLGEACAQDLADLKSALESR